MFKKIVLIALVAMLSIAALPTASVSASELTDETSPPTGEVTGEKLEAAWERALLLNERVGKTFERVDTLTEKIQTLIEKADEKGMDTSAVQAALDAFNAAVDEAYPVYEAAQDVIAAHAGFDANGKVTDAETAQATLKSLGESLKEIRGMTVESGKALRDAIKAFREANPRPEKPEGASFSPSTSG
ncbi:MAG: hypothetical protein HN855_15545 [Anaerolineae bacterium]|jgi:hypothetical protein|nr:hypothetical protein [Anaerolineae bacterium]MBT7072434.1 hypothetical protein [Anaerolineae bacterium]MBT7326569.1 hypothetical protein [Anaerolineae bacterium]